MSPNKIFFSALALLTPITMACAAELSGYVVKIEDGDTLTILAGETQYRIRLAQIDAPEVRHGVKRPGQPFGQASRQSLGELAFKKTAVARCGSPDRYGRLVCDVLVNGRSVNKEQVRRGMAWTYTQYAADPSYQLEQDKARSGGVGLWADKNPVQPWMWRRTAWDSQGLLENNN